MWDPLQYERFRKERSRPFFDLIARIPDRSYKTICDLGCGTGDLTGVLAEQWPEARVLGVDSSREMLLAAEKAEVPDRVDFTPGDITTWRPAEPQDLVVSNATFQWIPDAAALIKHVASYLGPKGVLAVQMPNNAESPSQVILRDLEADARWATKLQGRTRQDLIPPLSRWMELLWAEKLIVDAWESVYLHVLDGADAVLEWMKGTTLRPVLKALDEKECGEFLAMYRERLGSAYPSFPTGTVFPFQRLFFVARKS